MLNNFKNYIRKKDLLAASKRKRNLKGTNFQTAKSLGLVMCYKFDLENNALTRIKQIVEENNIKMSMLVYYPEKKLPENVESSSDKLVFSNKECNWVGKPKIKEVSDFLNQEFDLLIDMSSVNYFQLQYIVSMSKASFKIGQVDYENKPYDLQVKNDENNDEKFINDLELYLPKFK